MASERKSEGRRSCRPLMESLEQRAVPTTFLAATTAQLQADIATVNNSTGPNTIVLAKGRYDIPSALQINNSNNLTIRGATASGASTTELIGGTLDRVFQINGGTVKLQNLTIVGGGNVQEGGGIETLNANVTLQNSTVLDSSARLAGGGIFAQGGTLDLVSSTIGNNAATSGSGSFGGGIAASNATVEITHSTITNNLAYGASVNLQASAIAAGGGVYAEGGTLKITSTTISSNMVVTSARAGSATSSGGGVATSNANSTITGSIVNSNTLVSTAQQVPTSQGSAVAASGGSMTITNGQISENSPGGNKVFFQSGANFVVKGTDVEGKKFAGSFTLGPNGFTPTE